MKQYKLFILTFLTVSLFATGGCGKKKEPDIKLNDYVPSTTSPMELETTTPENFPRVNLTSITCEAGSEIDYLSAIESVENMELEKSMVYVNSSEVNRFQPGIYNAYYTFDYMGQTVKGQISVTILESTSSTAPSDSGTSDETPPTSDETSENSVSDETPSASNANDPSDPASLPAPDAEPTPETPATLPAEQPVPDAIITLSSGETVTIKCTPDYYIVQTYTDETYTTENGFHYLTSELKIRMNNGDTQVLETVVNRVANVPETASP